MNEREEAARWAARAATWPAWRRAGLTEAQLRIAPASVRTNQGDRPAAGGGSQHGAGGVGVGSAADVRAGGRGVGRGCVTSRRSGRCWREWPRMPAPVIARADRVAVLVTVR